VKAISKEPDGADLGVRILRAKGEQRASDVGGQGFTQLPKVYSHGQATLEQLTILLD
jgi:hypothetical protein